MAGGTADGMADGTGGEGAGGGLAGPAGGSGAEEGCSVGSRPEGERWCWVGMSCILLCHGVKT